MAAATSDLKPPIRVVVFTGGPTLRHSVRRFLVQLDEHPQIDLLDVYCQSQGTTLAATTRDLWRRRRLLAVPLVLLHVAGEVVRYLRAPRKESELNRKVESLTARIHFVPDLHAESVLDEVRRLSPDLGLIYGSPILKPALFDLPTCGTLGIHHGKMPDYRGKKTTFWALYNGERAAGVTIQKVNAGLDTGEVVKQGEVPAGGRALGDVWRDLERLGYQLFVEAILEVRAGTAIPLPRSGNKGKLYRDPSLRDIVQFWMRRSRFPFRKPGQHMEA